ncbi:2672_t:CDS:2, partial [Cetraspora pellucida]
NDPKNSTNIKNRKSTFSLEIQELKKLASPSKLIEVKVNKGKQKECTLKEVELSDHNEDNTDKLFNKIEYKSEKLEEIKSFASDNFLIDDEELKELENKI